AVRHVLDASAVEGTGAEAARGRGDLHGGQRAVQRRRARRRPDRPIYRRRGGGDGLLTMADRDPGRVSAEVDWREVARLVLTSREMDRIEEQELVPAKKVLYQFSARGHDMAQV